MLRPPLRLLLGVALCTASLAAAPLTVTVSAPARPETGYFLMGSPRDPAGHLLTLDNVSLRLDGQPWLPVMGEFHYARYPVAEWREELLKMKAGGIDIVATYVFWIHHEKVEGAWDWAGQKDLRRFVETARDVGLHVVVRCGPWCHGEVRNGGIPEWAVERKDWKVRTTDPKFLEAVRALYGQIAAQVKGLLWKDGGPVIGIQLDNEYWGPAEYLVTLKQIARDQGLDVPLYTRTGWPALKTPMPLGEIVPLYGAYAEGFWDRELTSMPGRYWAAFHIATLRSDAAIATEMLGARAAKDDPDAAKYPYLTCEIGGGMMPSYHRRILIDPRDVEATTLVKIAGGSTLPGYYMYHGGTNPEGRTPLMEAQDTLMTNYNDLPVKTYDFQAPLGEYGEVRPQYHRLRRLHSFLHTYGAELATMPTSLPVDRPKGRDDVTTLRWSVRSDGRRGFVFINNYERGRTLPAKPDAQLAIALADGSSVTFPGVTIPESLIAWWPFNLSLGGAVLRYATAVPITHVAESNGLRTFFFAASPGVPVEFALPAEQVEWIDAKGQVAKEGDLIVIHNINPGRAPAIRLRTKTGEGIQCVVLTEADSFALWSGSLGGRQSVILTDANLVFDNGAVQATATAAGPRPIAVFPAPAEFGVDGLLLKPSRDGVFAQYTLPAGFTTTPVPFTAVRAAGPLRTITLGAQKAAAEPKDADFGAAAVWRIKLPATLDPARLPLLRINYVGDVARVMLGDRLITDDFYHGRSRDVGLWRYPEAKGAELQFSVLPLQKDAPIFLADSARPTFGDRAAVAEVRSVELVETTTFNLTAKPGASPRLPANFRTDTSWEKPARP